MLTSLINRYRAHLTCSALHLCLSALDACASHASGTAHVWVLVELRVLCFPQTRRGAACCRQAKQDSLSLLEACFKNWPPDAYASCISRIWFALKRETSEPLDPPTASQKDSAVLALQTLKSCLLAESQWSSSAPSSTHPDRQGSLLSKVQP